MSSRSYKSEQREYYKLINEELFEKNFNLSQIENEINKINKEKKNDKKFD